MSYCRGIGSQCASSTDQVRPRDAYGNVAIIWERLPIRVWNANKDRPNQRNMVLLPFFDPRQSLGNRIDLIVITALWEAQELTNQVTQPGGMLGKKHRPPLEARLRCKKPGHFVDVRSDGDRVNLFAPQFLDEGGS